MVRDHPSGYLPAVKLSRPPQSVASTNLPLEDSESIVRAYKRKKQECETLRGDLVSMETEVAQLRQQADANQDELLRAERN